MEVIKIKNKGGIFFTALVLIIISLFLISYIFFSSTEISKTTQRRVETLNNFLLSLEEDLPRKIYVSGYRTIFLFEKRIIDKGDYIKNVSESFGEAFFKGTIEGTTSDEIDALLTGAKYDDIINDIKAKASKLNADINFFKPNITISQDDPWYVKVTFIANLSLFDKSDLVSWNRTEIIVSYIPVEGFNDPFFTVYSRNPSLTNPINKTIYSTFKSVEDLTDHAQKTYYMANSDAPSFLDRLEGNMIAPNKNGIESLAVPKLPFISGTSIVDHEYYQRTAGSKVSQMPSWFYIDTEHSNIYSVSK